jgi:ribosomal protein S18 acetylase RimI-like enzyme
MAGVREFSEADFDDLVARWHDTNRLTYTYVNEHQRHTLDEARAFFRSMVLVECEVWVAAEGAALQGLIAFGGGWIRQLTVFPAYQRQSIGSQLLARARELSPAGLRLYTFQRNWPAREFYAKHGFTLVKFGVSPAPENEPDVDYAWAPG